MTETDQGGGTVSTIGRVLPAVVSVFVLLITWHLVAELVQSAVLPEPMEVLQFLVSEASSGALFYHLGMTLWRVVAAFCVAMMIGTAIGLVLGMAPRANRFFDPWVVLLLNVPALVVIVLAYVWLGLTEVAAIGAVAVNKVPNVVVTVREGARALDRAYMDVARVFRFNRWSVLRDIVLPQLQPFLAAATRSGISLIWKIVLVVELLGRSNGVGFQIHLYFQLFDVAAILGYTAVFVLIMLLVELFILQPYEQRASRWRGASA